MNVGLVVPGFGASDEDWCIPALSQYTRALSRAHSVRVFSLRYPPSRAPYRAHGAGVVPLGGGTLGGLRRFGLVRRAEAAITDAHRERAFDVLHAFWADEPGHVATRAGRRLGVPTLVSVAGGELVAIPEIAYGGLTSRWNRRFLAGALRRADTVGVGSTTTAVRVEGAFREVAYLPLGTDTRRFHPRGSDASPVSKVLRGDPALLHVASLTPVKDQATLLHAFARVLEQTPGASLHMVGDGPLRGHLENLASALGVERSVRFHGAVDHHALVDYYRSADLLVMSSLHEAQGMAVVEAAACGLPTVGTDVGVIVDLAPASVVVPRRDAGALASAVAALARDPERRRVMGSQAASRARGVYSLEASVARFESAYREIGG